MLIVDDNEESRRLSSEIVEGSGFLVDLATNGEEAVEKVRLSREGYYDMILMDIIMHGKNGYEATRDIRKLLRADSERIEQVVINLLDNAIKFTGEGGRITLTTEQAAEGIAVTVRDNGCGVPPEDRGKIFDRFFTADRAHTAGKGTGLGLSICQRILEMHGREIRLMDTDEGAAFRFTLERGASPAKGGNGG